MARSPDDGDPDYGEFLRERVEGEHEGEEDEDDDQTTEDEEDSGQEEYIQVEDSPGVSVGNNIAGNPVSTAAPARFDAEEARAKRRREAEGEACCSSGFGSAVDSQESQWNRSEIDGLFCPICMDAWTDDGDHHVCCLPCGHIYGMSCIKRWLQQRGKSGKCPQCNHACRLKDIRKLFASRIVTVDEESQKRIRYLEARCSALEKKVAGWHKKEVEWRSKERKWQKDLDDCQSRQAELNERFDRIEERTNHLESVVEELKSTPLGSPAASWAWRGQSTHGHEDGLRSSEEGSSGSFKLQTEVRVDGARLLDICASSQMLVIARRLSGIGVRDALTKMSLIFPHELEDIILPPDTKAVRDLHISPFDGSLAIFSSLGKTLSVVSLQSNNVILSYNLPVPAWSCSWDFNDPNHVYAGLQNGMLLVFDMRQTLKPMESLEGLSCNPVHTVCSIINKESHGPRTVLTASSIGLCQWKIDCGDERPSLVRESANQGVCISLAYSSSSNDVVASYRPKVEMSNEAGVSHPLSTPFPVVGPGTQGSHVLLRRVGDSYHNMGSTCANVSDIRLPRSVIIDMENHNTLLASGDEATNELILQELPLFSTIQRFKLQRHPLRDVKYSMAMKQGILSCLSEDSLQLFKTKIL